MSRALDQIGRKLARARRGLDELRESLGAFDQANIDVGFEIGRVDGMPMFALPDLEASMDPEWELIVGEIAYQARSSLDQLIGAAVVHAGGRLEDHRGSYPITSTRGDYLNHKPGRESYRDRALAGTAEAVRLVVDDTQPWTVDEPSMHPLAQLNTLCNGDKHRSTQPAISVVRARDLAVHLPQGIKVWVDPSGRSEWRERIEVGQAMPWLDDRQIEALEELAQIHPELQMDPEHITPIMRWAVTFGDASIYFFELVRFVNFVEAEVVARIAPLIAHESA